jgi:putative ABC transport system ATP-binding protein
MALIDLKQVSKVYESGDTLLYALRQVNLTVEPGEFVAIMGPSGSGKSTMLHMMGLLDVPTGGEVFIEGKGTSSLPERDMARLRNQKLGFVFQNFNLLPRTSALENIQLPLFYAGYSPSEAARRARHALSRVGLDPETKESRHPNQLSGGQQQRVAIARAVVTAPQLILADEPTGNLDSQSTHEILALFQSLNDEGTTVVLVTHEPEVGRHAKRVIHFRDGEVWSDEPVKDRLFAEARVGS